MDFAGDAVQSITNGLVRICLKDKGTLRIPIVSTAGELPSLETGDLFSISNPSVAAFSSF